MSFFSPHIIPALLLLLRHTFERFTMVKPPTTRPGSSERYIIGLGFCLGAKERDSLVERLLDVLDSMKRRRDVEKGEKMRGAHTHTQSPLDAKSRDAVEREIEQPVDVDQRQREKEEKGKEVKGLEEDDRSEVEEAVCPSDWLLPPETVLRAYDFCSWIREVNQRYRGTQ